MAQRIQNSEDFNHLIITIFSTMLSIHWDKMWFTYVYWLYGNIFNLTIAFPCWQQRAFCPKNELWSH